MSDAIEAPAVDAAPEVPEGQTESKAEAVAESLAGGEKKAPEPKPAPKMHRVKVNGREIDVDEAELLESGKTATQIRRAAEERFAQAKRMLAEVEARQKKLTESPEDALSELLGGKEKFLALAEQALIRKLQLEQMDPHARAAMEARQALEAERKARMDIEQQIRDQQAQALQAQFAQEFDSQFTEALESHGLPRTPDTVRRMAQLQVKAIDMGLQLAPKDIAKIVRDDFVSEQASTLAHLSGDKLLAALGPELRKRIRAAEVASVKGKPAAAAAPAPKPADIPKRPMTQDEWREWMLRDA